MQRFFVFCAAAFVATGGAAVSVPAVAQSAQPQASTAPPAPPKKTSIWKTLTGAVQAGVAQGGQNGTSGNPATEPGGGVIVMPQPPQHPDPAVRRREADPCWQAAKRENNIDVGAICSVSIKRANGKSTKDMVWEANGGAELDRRAADARARQAAAQADMARYQKQQDDALAQLEALNRQAQAEAAKHAPPAKRRR